MRIAAFIVLMIGVSVVAIAAEKVYDVSTAAFVSPVPSIGVDGVSETWGFEAGEGFAPGFIGGQVGWTAFAASTAEGHIDTANPSAGSQHLRISNDPTVGGGILLGAFSPSVVDPIVDASSMSVYVAIGNVGGASYDVVPQSPNQGLLTARVKFDPAGDILVLDDLGGGLVFVDTGADWVPTSYNLLEVYVDPVGNTIDYWYGGSLIYSSVVGIVAGTVIEQVVLLSDNFNAGESGDFDDLSIDRGAVPVELQSLSID